MNKDKVLQLADHIEQLAKVELPDLATTVPNIRPTEFNMGVWHCGTAACIGGHAAWLFEIECKWSDREVGDVLDLTPNQIGNLFYPATGVGYDKITPEQAVGVLRKFAETGAIDWSFTYEGIEVPANAEALTI